MSQYQQRFAALKWGLSMLSGGLSVMLVLVLEMSV